MLVSEGGAATAAATFLHVRRFMPPRPTIAAAIEQIRSGQLFSSELVEQCLRRVTDSDDQIHAWAFVDESAARAAADACDRRIRNGEAIGPLHGIPIGVKDIIDVAGLPTVAGGAVANRTHRRAPRPSRRPTSCRGRNNSRQNGNNAIRVLDPARTRNPWNLAHTPGGSSSGSAAAVAAEMCWGAVGTQTGGSVIRPAAFCGIVGVKPTFGSIDTAGVLPLSPLLDTVGVMTNCVDDVPIDARRASRPPAGRRPARSRTA